MSNVAQQVRELIEPSITSMGFNLVQVKLNDGKHRLLQIMAERPDGSMTLDDCEKISRQISAILDVEDIIDSAYRLEVGSPGIDRPLVSLKDFENYKGHSAKLETILPIHGRKRFTGTIKAIEGENVVLAVDKEEFVIPHRDVQAAKLVLTDALIKAHQKKTA
ncbi:MAG: ribosome maturation factor RimP [Alphaproteobacteria bacterium]|nr:ribosome maturation factor RimP [Alphaproteobacteria bacterium]